MYAIIDFLTDPLVFLNRVIYINLLIISTVSRYCHNEDVRGSSLKLEMEHVVHNNDTNTFTDMVAPF